MLDEQYYPSRYKTAEARVLYLTGAKGYGLDGNRGGIVKLAEDLGVVRSYITECLLKGIPLRYASYLANKFEYHPALLAYETYLLVTQQNFGKEAVLYKEFLDQQNFFNESDKRYILNGTFITNPVKFLRTNNNKIRK